MPAGSSRTRSRSSSKRAATSAIGVVDSTRMPRSSVSCDSSAPSRRRSEVAVPPTATALVGRRRLEPLEGARHVAAHLLELVHGRRVARAGRSRRGSRSRSETTPTTPSAPSGSPTAISVEPPPTSTTAIVPSAGWHQRAGGAHEGQPRLLLAREHVERHAAGVLAPRPRSSARLGALRIAAVATATICSAPTSRATLACVRHHLGGLRDLLRGDRAAVARGSCRCA